MCICIYCHVPLLYSQLVGLYGPEASKHLFRCLVSFVDLTSDGRSYGKDGQQLQMLCQEANTLISKPNFVSILCHGFEKQESKVRGLGWRVGYTVHVHVTGTYRYLYVYIYMCSAQVPVHVLTLHYVCVHRCMRVCIQ